MLVIPARRRRRSTATQRLDAFGGGRLRNVECDQFLRRLLQQPGRLAMLVAHDVPAHRIGVSRADAAQLRAPAAIDATTCARTIDDDRRLIGHRRVEILARRVAAFTSLLSS